MGRFGPPLLHAAKSYPFYYIAWYFSILLPWGPYYFHLLTDHGHILAVRWMMPPPRLGSGEHDACELKEHPFFRCVDWQALREGRLSPPWAPCVDGSLDVSQFDNEFTSMQPIVSPDVRDAYFGSLENQAFAGFTFVDESASHLLVQAQQSMSQQASSLSKAGSGGRQRGRKPH